MGFDEYVDRNDQPIALDDNDGGLHELRETITESFSKKFNSTAEKEFLRRMKFLFEHLSLYYPITSIERNYKRRDTCGEYNKSGKFVYESMFGEVTGEGKNNTEKKNLIDLVRLGIFMKDSLDNISRKTGVNRIFGWQVIVTKWTGYMMTLISPGIYVMIECRSSKIFRSMQYVSIWSGYAVCISGIT
ncbi:hypothetical protein RhiirA1_511951 [Rhizophagus irregularis]|uniref:Uncharacterized protein n=1 Tax=Rhizophagus irregularis TaxID=588596 RepID=A0A2N0QQ31_9GLOM|nr:hypothetical protein RhiirA1_511951 [Rhizophagus irregularis]